MTPRDTMQRCRSTYAKWIDRLLLDDSLSPRRLARLREHLTGCELCQARYNRAVQASRLLAGGPAALSEPSPAELARVRDRLLGRARLTPEERPRRVWLLGALGALTAAALAGLILWPKLRRSNEVAPPGAPEFQTRGTTAASPEGQLNLRAFCAGDGPGRPLRELVPREPDPPRCGLQGVLRFAYTNRSRHGYLFVVGLDESYAPKWYEPAPAARQSLALRGDAVDEPLKRAVQLRVNHRQGLLRLFALFSAKPVSIAAVERAARTAQKARTPLGELRTLPVAETEQRSLLVRLEP